MKTNAIVERRASFRCGHVPLCGFLRIPTTALGVIAFAHASGGGRFSPRNQYLAATLEKAGFATLLFDLLDENEAESHEKIHDIELLANRLQHAADWLADDVETRDLPLGYFGEGTGSAAALLAAACYPAPVRAIVSRSGRLDLVQEDLAVVKAPTLLIVGGNDELTRTCNKDANRRMRCEKELVVVPGATHSFGEPGALCEVARRASEWFLRFVPFAASAAMLGPHAPSRTGISN